MIAIEEDKTTSAEEERKVLREKTFGTYYGPAHFGKTGQTDFNAALVMQTQSGKLVVLAPDNLR